ncbi:FadR/GntR family transcriptional regulator [Rhodovulum sulfidophilum]|uniref:FadR/GntR family transcriptional regulator n=1 Tax=Rhodovulum sulfidophilum TaxID=35806 RepID=UPI001389CA6F|nr:GntR family transcriptional regulator [Rhodovulum sulfidophilum]NDK35030.1 FadR family transcriptional regulator [Rhodovulum sulfidophilum]
MPKEKDIAPIRGTGATDQLTEREPADRFGVSRPMLREAMRALAVLGVIEVRPGGGAWVSALDANSLLSPLNVFLGLSEISVDRLCQARRLIGGALAARQAKAADLEALDPPVAGGGRSRSRFRFPRPASQAGRSLFPCPRRPEPERAEARILQGRRPYRRDGAPVHRRIGEAPRAGDASRQAMGAPIEQARTSPLGISQPPPAKGFSRMTGAQA